MENFDAKKIIDNFRAKMSETIIGQKELIDGILMSYIAGGHILLEGVPGLAKTLIVKTFAELTGMSFNRIQFTPDLLPSDLIGTLIYQQNTSTFSVKHGPVFANLILADEINRAPAKVQSALLEAMAEYQVTIGETSYKLPEPFFVLATQNPIEHEGVYPLPEAELDRFLLKLFVDYPSIDEEAAIVNKFSGLTKKNNTNKEIQPVLSIQDLENLRICADNITCTPEITNYIVSITAATRPISEQDIYSHGNYLSYISYGASPRAAIAIQKCAKIKAMFENRKFVIPEDVKYTALPALRHRIQLSYEAAADNLTADSIILKLLNIIPQP